MKKIIYIIGILLGSLFLTSCNKPKPAEDLENAVIKLEYFNNTFEEYYADGVITVKEDHTGEYSKLKDIANEYYELMNKINANVEEERENIQKGKKTDLYEETYKKSLVSMDSRIQKETAQFNKNLEILATVKK